MKVIRIVLLFVSVYWGISIFFLQNTDIIISHYIFAVLLLIPNLLLAIELCCSLFLKIKLIETLSRNISIAVLFVISFLSSSYMLGLNDIIFRGALPFGVYMPLWIIFCINIINLWLFSVCYNCVGRKLLIMSVFCMLLLLLFVIFLSIPTYYFSIYFSPILFWLISCLMFKTSNRYDTTEGKAQMSVKMNNKISGLL